MPNESNLDHAAKMGWCFLPITQGTMEGRKLQSCFPCDTIGRCKLPAGHDGRCSLMATLPTTDTKKAHL